LLGGDERGSESGARSARDESALFESDLQDVPAPLQVLFTEENARFRPFLGLLSDRELAGLIRILFSDGLAPLVAPAIVFTPNKIIDEALARELSKSLEDVTDRDRRAITKLDLLASEIEDLRPLASLTSLQWLNLYSTQVSQTQIVELKQALRKLDVVS
jgi:Leucine-rich repeat (LRR) protein